LREPVHPLLAGDEAVKAVLEHESGERVGAEVAADVDDAADRCGLASCSGGGLVDASVRVREVGRLPVSSACSGCVASGITKTPNFTGRP